MKNGLTRSIQADLAECEICGSVITYHDTLLFKDKDASVCRSFNCQRLMRQKDSMSPLMFKSHLAFQKKLLTDHREKEAERQKRIAEVEQIQDKEHKKVLASILETQPDLSRESIEIVVIPCGLSQSSKPSQERIDTYLEHLKSIINKAETYSNATEVEHDQHHDAHEKLQLVEKHFKQHPSIKKMCDQLCTLCKGGCCVSGNEHAYLSVFSMRSFMDKNPDLSTQEIRQLYISKISPTTINDSCINHTHTGCALPRELRSDICNAFYCDALKNYQKNPAVNSRPHTVLAIQRSNTYSSWFDPEAKNDIIGFTLKERTLEND